MGFGYLLLLDFGSDTIPVKKGGSVLAASRTSHGAGCLNSLFHFLCVPKLSGIALRDFRVIIRGHTHAHYTTHTRSTMSILGTNYMKTTCKEVINVSYN